MLLGDMRCGASPSARIAAVRIKRFEGDVEGAARAGPHRPADAASGAGSPAGRGGWATRNGASASVGDDPGRHGRSRSSCRGTGPSGCDSHLLDVARRPVVDQAEPEDVLAGLGDRDRLAQLVAGPDPDRQLQLVVELAARAVARRRLVGQLALAVAAGAPARPTAAPTTPGCDTRPARIYSSGSAGCSDRAGVRHWWRDGCRRRNR